MSDRLQDYLKKHRPEVPPVPPDEWERINARVQDIGKKRRQRVLYYASATLAAAGMMAFLNFARQNPEADAWLEPDDVIYQVEVQDRGAYQDWLSMADSVVDLAAE